MERKIIQPGDLPCYAYLNRYLNRFCLALFVRGGSIFESDRENGVSHLLEHTLIRNLNRKYGGQFYDLLALNGLHISGECYKEFICFFVEGPPAGFDFAVEMMRELFSPLSLSGKDFLAEKQRIKAEIREKEERYTAGFAFKTLVWKGSNAEKTILGYCRNLDRMSLKGLEEFRTKTLSAGNCFLCLTGNVSDERLDRLEEMIGSLTLRKDQPRRENRVTVPDAFFHRTGESKLKDGGYCTVHMGFDVDITRHEPGTLDLLYKILFVSENALLFQGISEENPLVYSYDSRFEQYDNIGNLYFDFEISLDRLVSGVEQVVETLHRLIRGNYRFEAHLNYKLSTWTCLQDNPYDLNWSLGYNNHVLDTAPVDYDKPRLGRYGDVTVEAITRSAREIFRRENLTILICGPKGKIPVDRINAALSRLNCVEEMN